MPIVIIIVVGTASAGGGWILLLSLGLLLSTFSDSGVGELGATNTLVFSSRCYTDLDKGLRVESEMGLLAKEKDAEYKEKGLVPSKKEVDSFMARVEAKFNSSGAIWLDKGVEVNVLMTPGSNPEGGIVSLSSPYGAGFRLVESRIGSQQKCYIRKSQLECGLFDWIKWKWFSKTPSQRTAATKATETQLNRSASLPQSFIKDYENKYLTSPDYKAIALALDSNGNASWGWSYRSDNQTSANDRALSACNDRRPKNNTNSDCKLYAVGGVIVWNTQEN